MGSPDRFEGENPIRAPGVTSGPGWGCDSKRITKWRALGGAVKLVPSCIPDYSLPMPNGGAFKPTPSKHLPTIMDRLQAAGLSWRIYGDPTPPSGGGPTAAGNGLPLQQCVQLSSGTAPARAYHLPPVAA